MDERCLYKRFWNSQNTADAVFIKQALYMIANDVHLYYCSLETSVTTLMWSIWLRLYFWANIVRRWWNLLLVLKKQLRKYKAFSFLFLFVPCRAIDPPPSSPLQKAEVISSEGYVGAECKLNCAKPEQIFTASLQICIFQA